MDGAPSSVASARTLRTDIPASLPIAAHRDELVAAIRDHPVVIVAGDTGSGKSTQLPKICLEAGRGVTGLIGHTQPRRVAARSVAERVAEEMGTPLGAAVGYSVRFTDRVSDDTVVRVMTDGILLAEIQRDRQLRRYDTLIVDEAHERSLNIDFLLGYMKRLLPERPELRVVITSATIDTARFAAHFGGAPVVEVAGRSYPVEVRYRPYPAEPDDDRDQVQAVCDAVDELVDHGPGDILVFLSGEREIHDTADAVRRMALRETEVLPLYARLSAAEQHRVFQDHPGRRVVLATNVAETSITVPGVRFVVDTGTARVSRYSRRLKVQRLPIEPVSQASANQRAGRCGRVAPGVCIRLYDEADFDVRPAFTEPEILRTNLASVILQMAALGLGDVASFPFLDPPDARSIRDGITLLQELGALTDADTPCLTTIGRRLARLPLDPRLGRMILEADRLGSVREVMVIAAGLTIQDPRERPADQQEAAAAMHRRFQGEGSDFCALVELWDHVREQQRALSSNQFRKLCRAEFLHYLRIREWQDLYSQLRQVTSSLGIRMNGAPAHPGHVHRAVLAGLLSQIGVRDEQGREFLGARGARFLIAPGSVLAKKPPRWVMAGELVETNRLWARVTARIQPDWAEQLGAHLVKRSYGEPGWDGVRGAATTVERVTLYGVPLVAGRRVPLARTDQALARELLIRHALVEGDWHARHRFVTRNRARIDEVHRIEERVRRRDLLVGDDGLFAFFDTRLPADVASVSHFDRWWKVERQHRPGLLDLGPTDMLRVDPDTVDESAFPDRWTVGDLTLDVTYRFAPGEPDDGVRVHVPLPVLTRLSPAPFSWHVPGHRRELVTHLVRTLPKHLRKLVVPAQETADTVLGRLVRTDGHLLEWLAAEVSRVAMTPVRAGDFHPDHLPAHLRVGFVVEDTDGTVLGTGHDLMELQERLRARARASLAAAAPGLERTGLVAWDVDEVPRTVEIERSGYRAVGYPALVDDGDSVSLRVLTTEAAQQRAMQPAVRRLLLLGYPALERALARHARNPVKLALARLGRSTIEELAADCAGAAADEVIAESGGPPFDREAFTSLARRARDRMPELGKQAFDTAGRVLERAAALEQRFDAVHADALVPAVEDMRIQVSRLVRPGFVTASGIARLGDIERYLQGVARRLEKLPADVAKDRQRMRTVQELERRYRAALQGVTTPEQLARVGAVRWLVEELRVSLFAQVLGTAVPVSEQRILRELAALDSPS
jgi:ATP-dependent helicase HrpA